MYCPNCGHQPSSATPRFCSSCGMRLDGVVRLIETGGALELAGTNAPTTSKLMSPKRRGMRLGAKMMFVSFVMLPFAIGLSIAADSPGPLFIPMITFFLGLSRSLYARLFSEDVVTPPPPPLNINPPNGESVSFASRLTPPSAVEPTTKLLGRE